LANEKIVSLVPLTEEEKQELTRKYYSTSIKTELFGGEIYTLFC